jgi:pyridoxal biosynthesis lyase PdxS
VSEQRNQHLLDLPNMIAVGIASPAGAALTSRFGVAGTLVGLVLSAVIITVDTDLLRFT